jgi:hypothetical protein
MTARDNDVTFASGQAFFVTLYNPPGFGFGPFFVL